MVTACRNPDGNGGRANDSPNCAMHLALAHALASDTIPTAKTQSDRGARLSTPAIIRK